MGYFDGNSYKELDLYEYQVEAVYKEPTKVVIGFNREESDNKSNFDDFLKSPLAEIEADIKPTLISTDINKSIIACVNNDHCGCISDCEYDDNYQCYPSRDENEDIDSLRIEANNNSRA